VQLTDPILHPVYLASLLDKHIPGWVGMDARELRDAVGVLGPCSQENWSKIQAARTVKTAASVLDDFRVFAFVVQALNGGVPDFRVLEAPELPDLLAGAQMIVLLRSFEDVVFSSEVVRFAAVVCDLVASGPLPAPLQETSEYVRVPVVDPDRVKEAEDYADRVNGVLIQQLGGLT
jgi:hypothetical protein